MLKTIRQLWEHIQWADQRILDALLDGLYRGAGSRKGRRPPKATPDVIREFAHIIGSEETWLARLERRTPQVPVWPDGSLRELEDLVANTHEQCL